MHSSLFFKLFALLGNKATTNLKKLTQDIGYMSALSMSTEL